MNTKETGNLLIALGQVMVSDNSTLREVLQSKKQVAQVISTLEHVGIDHKRATILVQAFADALDSAYFQHLLDEKTEHLEECLHTEGGEERVATKGKRAPTEEAGHEMVRYRSPKQLRQSVYSDFFWSVQDAFQIPLRQINVHKPFKDWGFEDADLDVRLSVLWNTFTESLSIAVIDLVELEKNQSVSDFLYAMLKTMVSEEPEYKNALWKISEEGSFAEPSLSDDIAEWIIEVLEPLKDQS